MSITRKVEEAVRAVTDFRHYIHENPELAMHEVKATKRIMEELAKLPNVETKDYNPGVVAVLNGKKPGKTLALRADMDALPVTEESGLPFASKTEGVCHACGHDLHASILLGCAMVLSSMTDELSGTVKFIFQPAEETMQGALHMIKCGAMENPKLDAIISLHSWPNEPVGTIAVKHGPMMAGADFLDITVTGRSGHAAYPQRSIDSVLIAAQVVNALQAIVARETDPLEAAVVTLGTINGGTVRNIIAPEVVMTGTVRALNEPVRDKMPERIERIATHTAEAFGGTAKINYMRGTPPVINDNAVVDLVIGAAEQTIGAENIRYLPTPVMGGEDMSFFMQTVPGMFFRLGTATDDEQTKLPLHSSKIRFGEGAFVTGMKVLCQTALNFLK